MDLSLKLFGYRLDVLPLFGATSYLSLKDCIVSWEQVDGGIEVWIRRYSRWRFEPAA